MLKIIFTRTIPAEDIAADARRLHAEMMEKNDLPRIAGASRAIIPTWCYGCNGKTWGTHSYPLCDDCRGEGKTPIGF